MEHNRTNWTTVEGNCNIGSCEKGNFFANVYNQTELN